MSAICFDYFVTNIFDFRVLVTIFPTNQMHHHSIYLKKWKMSKLRKLNPILSSKQVFILKFYFIVIQQK